MSFGTVAVRLARRRRSSSTASTFSILQARSARGQKHREVCLQCLKDGSSAGTCPFEKPLQLGERVRGLVLGPLEESNRPEMCSHVHLVGVNSQALDHGVEDLLNFFPVSVLDGGESDEIVFLSYRSIWGKKCCPNSFCAGAFLETELEVLFSLVGQADQNPGVPDVDRMLFPVAEDVQGGFDCSPPVDFVLGLDVKSGLLFIDADFGTKRLLNLG